MSSLLDPCLGWSTGALLFPLCDRMCNQALQHYVAATHVQHKPLLDWQARLSSAICYGCM